jgi:hypothetical protein
LRIAGSAAERTEHADASRIDTGRPISSCSSWSCDRRSR